MPADAARPIRVVIIDDHDAIHAGIALWCAQATPPIRIVGNYIHAEEFLQAHPHPSDRVDVVLLDLELDSRRPDFTNIEHISTAGHRVIVYSHITHSETILKCLDLGAITYISKTEGRDHLLEAIHAAAHDTAHVGPRMAAAITDDRRVGRPRLTDREQQVLLAWFQTESKDLVGQQLFISPSSVKTHLQRIRAKYAAVGRPATTKAALIARAVQDGTISIDEL